MPVARRSLVGVLVVDTRAPGMVPAPFRQRRPYYD